MKKIVSVENLLLVVGSFLCAISVNIWAIPNELSEGGIMGLSLLFYYIFGIAPAISNMVFNGILIIIGWKFLGRRTMLRTIVVIMLISLFLGILEPYGVELENTIIAAILAGLFMGVGVGTVYRGSGTTAGGAIIASLLDKYFHIPKSRSLLGTDLMVVLPSAFVIGLEKMLLTLISIYVGMKAIEYVIEGARPRKSVMVMSSKYEEIAKSLEQNVNRGITFLESQGYYSRQSTKIIFTVIEMDELLEVGRIVHTIDPDAFMIVNDAQNVFGSGFDQMMIKDKKKRSLIPSLKSKQMSNNK